MNIDERSVAQFLFEEAARLDAHDYLGWFELVSEDIEYRVPIPPPWTDRPGAPEDEAAAMHFEDDFNGLHARVLRMGSKAAWSEQPIPLCCRSITNVRVGPREGDELAVRSVFVLVRSHGHGPPTLLAGHRDDRLRATPAGLRLCRRTVTLAHRTIFGSLTTLL